MRRLSWPGPPLWACAYCEFRLSNGQCKNRIALPGFFAQYLPMLARVLSAALSAIAPRGATADVNVIEAFPIEVEVNSGWGDTVIVIVGLPDAAVPCSVNSFGFDIGLKAAARCR